MRLVYILRHGHSEHLLGGFQHRVSSCRYVHSLRRWENASLTPEGHEQAEGVAARLRKACSCILSSPMRRTMQTASIVAGEEHEVRPLPLLREIDELPWRLPHWLRLREYTWFYVIFLLMLLDGRVLRLLREAGQVLCGALHAGRPCLLVSHKARILSLLVYARLHPRWRVVSCDLEPAGVTILARV